MIRLPRTEIGSFTNLPPILRRPGIWAESARRVKDSLGTSPGPSCQIDNSESGTGFEWHTLVRLKGCEFPGKHAAGIDHGLLDQREHEPGSWQNKQEPGQDTQEGGTFTIWQEGLDESAGIWLNNCRKASKPWNTQRTQIHPNSFGQTPGFVAAKIRPTRPMAPPDRDISFTKGNLITEGGVAFEGARLQPAGSLVSVMP